MNIATLCEKSGRVRDAFATLGHYVVSCDLQPSDTPGNHIQGDCRDYKELWETMDMIIAFPDCRYLSSAGNKWLAVDKEREQKRREAYEFVMWLWKLKVKRKCIENPKGYLNGRFPSPDPENPDKSIIIKPQLVQPWFWGDPEWKTTCLWLQGLPKLLHHAESDLFFKKTHIEKPAPIYQHKQGKKKGKNVYFVESIGGRKDRQNIRSRFFPGMSNAMAEQWGKL